MPAIWIQEHIKRVMHHDQVRFIPECKVGLTYENQSTTLIEWKKKKNNNPHDSWFSQEKHMTKAGIEGNFFSLIKDIYEKLTLNIILSGKRQSFPLDQEQDEDAIFIISVQHCIGSSI